MVDPVQYFLVKKTIYLHKLLVSRWYRHEKYARVRNKIVIH